MIITKNEMKKPQIRLAQNISRLSQVIARLEYQGKIVEIRTKHNIPIGKDLSEGITKSYEQRKKEKKKWWLELMSDTAHSERINNYEDDMNKISQGLTKEDKDALEEYITLGGSLIANDNSHIQFVVADGKINNACIWVKGLSPWEILQEVKKIQEKAPHLIPPDKWRKTREWENFIFSDLIYKLYKKNKTPKEIVSYITNLVENLRLTTEQEASVNIPTENSISKTIQRYKERMKKG